MTEWYLIQNGQQVGPLSTQEIKQMALTGKLQPHDQIKKGETGQSMRADKIKGLFKTENTSQRTPATPPPLPQTLIVPEPPVVVPSPFVESAALPQPSQTNFPWGVVAMVLGGAGFGGFILIALLLLLNSSGQGQISLRWREDTAKLMEVASSLTVDQQKVLGLKEVVAQADAGPSRYDRFNNGRSVVDMEIAGFGRAKEPGEKTDNTADHLNPKWTQLHYGKDIYGAEVQIRNTGTVPLNVSPDNLRINFGQQDSRVYSVEDRQFLRAVQLQPGEVVSGLVAFSAEANIVGTAKFEYGRLLYVDSSLQVTYE